MALLIAADKSSAFSLLEFAFTIHIVIYTWFLLYKYYNAYMDMYIVILS